MKTIAVLLPYFGKFPNCFEFFLQSCKDDSTVDFYVITDNDSDKYHIDKDSNIHFYKTTVKKIITRFQNAFRFKTNLTRPYLFT